MTSEQKKHTDQEYNTTVVAAIEIRDMFIRRLNDISITGRKRVFFLRHVQVDGHNRNPIAVFHTQIDGGT